MTKIPDPGSPGCNLIKSDRPEQPAEGDPGDPKTAGGSGPPTKGIPSGSPMLRSRQAETGGQTAQMAE